MAKSNGGSSSQVNDPNGLSLPHLIAAVITAVIGGGVFTMAGDMAAAGANIIMAGLMDAEIPKAEAGGRAKQFYPAVAQSDAARTETESFLGKVYGGSLGLMMSAMVEGRALTQEDIDELTAILEQAGGNTK